MQWENACDTKREVGLKQKFSQMCVCVCVCGRLGEVACHDVNILKGLGLQSIAAYLRLGRLLDHHLA